MLTPEAGTQGRRPPGRRPVRHSRAEARRKAARQRSPVDAAPARRRHARAAHEGHPLGLLFLGIRRHSPARDAARRPALRRELAILKKWIEGGATWEGGALHAAPPAAPGRDHNPDAFSFWIAGAGIQGGQVIGETGELGYKVVRQPVSVFDFHATVLHLLGIDHKRLTYFFNGRHLRLTGVHGELIPRIAGGGKAATGG
jgi:hypothetical protein